MKDLAFALGAGFMIALAPFALEKCRPQQGLASASLDQCAQSEQVCQAVAERMGIYVTIPPWQAMVLTPILDPR